MEANVLRQIEVDDVIFYAENQYNRTDQSKYRAVFDEMVATGRLTGNFGDIKWVGFSGVKRIGIEFTLDEKEYSSHFGRAFGISYKTIQNMLRCYALYVMGTYIFPTINQRIAWVRQFVTTFGDGIVVFPGDAAEVIQDFLFYIGTPEPDIDDMLLRIHFEQAKASRSRELSHLINYLAIANEINDLYHGSISDEDFKKWFPIFFWTNVTFIIPLRATEMLVTPLQCISRQDGRTFITLRRTTLKGKKQIVRYEVERDYKEFTYEIPNTWVVDVIERYQELTADRARKYLFDHTKYMINNMVSLQSFNHLLADFISTHLIGNSKYDYARFATGVTEFELVTAGDSRPIAMANLYFQDISADICRQLADHSQISTSFGYYTNVSNTIQCASIMQVQRRIHHQRNEVRTAENTYAVGRASGSKGGTISRCTSPHQPLVTGNISDCVQENHLHECLGCRFYYPSEEELRKELAKRKQKLDDISKRLVEHIADTRTGGSKKIDIDKLFLDTHTGAVRFKKISDQYAEEAEYKWRRHQSSQKRNS